MSNGLIIDPAGQTLVVTITGLPSGATIPLFTDVNLTSTQTNPLTISAPTTVYVANEGQASVSMKLNGVEVGTATGTTATVGFEDGTVGTVRAGGIATDGSLLVAPSVADNRPTWSVGTHRWDEQRGWYNLSPATLPKWTAAVFRMLAGSGSARITCVGDSTWQHSGLNPDSTYSIPAVLKSLLMSALGVSSGGTGIVPIWNDYDFASGGTGTNNPASEPRLIFSRNLANGTLTFPSNSGLYTTGMVALTDSGAQTNYVIFVPGISYDEFWVYSVEGGGRSYIAEMSTRTTTGGPDNYYNLSAFYGDASANPGGTTNVPVLAGYQRDPSGSGGQRVGKIAWGASGLHNVRIMDNLNVDSSTSYYLGVEAKIVAPGLIVDNFAQSGRALRNLFQNYNNNNGVGGPPLVEMLHPDLLIIPLMLNDYQASVSPSQFHTDLTALVQRQKTSGATGTNGNGVGANGDVLLFVSAQPNYASWPPVQPTTTLTDYYNVAYQVANEQNVALIDGAWRWQNYATSSVLMSDQVHPNQYGSHVHARNITDALLSVVGVNP